MENINNDIKEILITEKEINDACKVLAKKLDELYDGKKPILLSLLRGSIPFSVTLSKYMQIDVEYDYMRTSSYLGTSSTGEIKFSYKPESELKNRDIIIIEDIIDTGKTLYEVKNMLAEYNPKSIVIVTLLDKPAMRRIENFNADYALFTIPNYFVVGFGLDYNEKYRNLPYVGILKEEIYQK